MNSYPVLKTWHDRECCAWQHGNMESRTVTDRWGMDMQRLTDLLNTPVQGTGADGLKLALALLCERRDECLGAISVLVCHDEIVVECVTEQAVGVKGQAGKSDGRREGCGLEQCRRGKCATFEVESRVASSWGEG